MFIVLRSSAGAGKTHALVKHYLQRCLAGEDPSAYARVLALTFTNKAAGEMRERVLEYLEQLAGTAPLSVPLTDVRDGIMQATGMDADTLRNRADQTLRHMLHHWPRLAISTIDAFVRRLVTPFTRDLGLDRDLNMTTEEDRYRNLAVERLLTRAGNDEELTRVLLATCQQLLENERSWALDKPLKVLAAQLDKEQAQPYLAALKDIPMEGFLVLERELGTMTRAFRRSMREKGKQVVDAMRSAGIRMEHLAYGKGGPFKFFHDLADFQDLLLPNKFVQKVLESDKWLAGRCPPEMVAAVEALAPLFRSTVEFVLANEERMRTQVVASAVLHDLLPTACLHAIHSELAAIKQEDGVTFFSDLTRQVAGIVATEPAPFLYEKLGERYDHLLVDEFQDTSVKQWHVLLPLVDNALAKGGSVLLVGDAKQAIYRFRNGEARQFVQLPELFEKEEMLDGQLREDTLRRTYHDPGRLVANYRSARGIIDFNNELFGALAARAPDAARVYEEHAQAAARSEQGYVEVTCLQTDTDEQNEEDAEGNDSDTAAAPLLSPMQQYTLEKVRECLADGYRPCDIAVLVRTAGQGGSVSQALISDGLEVASADGMRLNSDTGVCTVITILEWLRHRSDTAAARAQQLMTRLRTGGQSVADLSADLSAPKAMRVWREAHPGLDTGLALTTLLLRIMDALGISPHNDTFAMALVQEAHAYSIAHGDDISAFLQQWSDTIHKRSASTAESSTAVHVLTIHKSKGLQYPVVIVPIGDLRVTGNRGERTWIAPGQVLPQLPAALVHRKKPLTDMGLPELEEEERLERLDELNLLYVAYTRAEQRLYVTVAPKGNAALATALREHFKLNEGERTTFGTRTTVTRPSITGAGGGMVLGDTGADGRRRLAIRNEAPMHWDPRDPDHYRSTGRIIHAMLADIRQAEDIQHAVREHGTRNGLPDEQCEAIGHTLRQVLEAPEAAAFFGPDLEVLSETTLITREGQALRPDRIVRDGGSTRVLDIKTGMPEPAHRRQVLTYAALLRELGEPEVSAHLLYLPAREFRTVDA